MAVVELVDGSGGYGAGVVDALLQAGHAPQEIQFGGKAINPRYYNKRSEMWFEMAEWVKRGGVLPSVAQLAKELTAPTYTFQGGKLRLEEKDQIKKRLGFSPDYGDALCLTFALPDMPAGKLPDGTLIPWLDVGAGMKSDYNPISDERMGAA